MKKILFSMCYSILVGEEPDPVLGKKKGEEAEPSQDDTDHSLLLKDLTISELELHLFSISIPEFYSMCFHAPLIPRKRKWKNFFSEEGIQDSSLQKRDNKYNK